MTKTKKINVDDLNGLTQTNYKVITVTIQEAHPIKFSEECEKLLKATNPEALIYYAISNVPIQTPNGTALVYIVNLQFWATEEEFKEWEADIRRKALFIKP